METDIYALLLRALVKAMLPEFSTTNLIMVVSHCKPKRN